MSDEFDEQAPPTMGDELYQGLDLGETPVYDGPSVTFGGRPVQEDGEIIRRTTVDQTEVRGPRYDDQATGTVVNLGSERDNGQPAREKKRRSSRARRNQDAQTTTTVVRTGNQPFDQAVVVDDAAATAAAANAAVTTAATTTTTEPTSDATTAEERSNSFIKRMQQRIREAGEKAQIDLLRRHGVAPAATTAPAVGTTPPAPPDVPPAPIVDLIAVPDRDDSLSLDELLDLLESESDAYVSLSTTQATGLANPHRTA